VHDGGSGRRRPRGQAAAIVTPSFFVFEMEVQKPAVKPMKNAGLEAPKAQFYIWYI
jgi:hypothetical protein